MSRLLLADDELTTRRGLRNGVPWEALGVSEIIEARDGVEALRLARENPPDIVLTDVRMPRLNGIELAIELRKLFPAIKIIFISGYSDKEYLRAAIRLGVISYVEKPICLGEITHAIRQATEHASAADAQPREDFLPLVRQDLIYRLLRPGAEAMDIEHSMALLGTHLSLNAWYAVLIMKLDGGAESLRHGVKRVEQSWPELVICEKEGLIIIVAQAADESFLLYTRDAVLRWLTEQDPDGGSFIAAGLPVRGMTTIHVSYEQAVVALQSFFFLGYGKVSLYKDASANGSDAPSSERLTEPFLKLLADGGYDELEHQACKICDTLAREPHMLVDHAKQLFAKLLLALRTESDRRYARTDAPRSADDGPLNSALSTRETLSQYKELLLSAVNAFMEHIGDTEGARPSPLCNHKITSALKLIESRYMDPSLCVNALADQVRLTQPYLSMLFKKTVGRSISEHLLELRVEKSKRLLIDEDIRLSEVARQVGYNDTNTYAKAFKRITGLSPANFRKRYHR